MKTDLRLRRRHQDHRLRGHALITHMALIFSAVFAVAMLLSRLAHP
ncbi:hypothetical protein [Ancylobacter oerskovii]|uniref:Uncharacterized protein n=1 Tax=Ancylobacter oerskovii TaxID=459519 RepID=A0ABW4Z1L9_9HYPH|nr:hypothetical protein [Ancylobacter oerskovii]MBS7545017.1 hypothetical protein [Ancylobacter oerskovii]